MMDLGPAQVAEIDTSGMFGEVAGLPGQLRDGYENARACSRRRLLRDLPGDPAGRAHGLVVCGMGGSAIGADLVLAALPGLAVPAVVVRGYHLPEWVGPETLVVVASYSGQTEESLACARAGAVARLRSRVRDVRRQLSARSRNARACRSSPSRAAGSRGRPSGCSPPRSSRHWRRRGCVTTTPPTSRTAASSSRRTTTCSVPALRTNRILPSPSRGAWRTGWPWSTAPGSLRRSPGAGRARSTRTPRLRPSSTSCRSSTTTS